MQFFYIKTTKNLKIDRILCSFATYFERVPTNTQYERQHHLEIINCTIFQSKFSFFDFLNFFRGFKCQNMYNFVNIGNGALKLARK